MYSAEWKEKKMNQIAFMYLGKTCCGIAYCWIMMNLLDHILKIYEDSEITGTCI